MTTKTRVRHASVSNLDWDLFKNEKGTFHQDDINQALLMDIRGWLERITFILECRNCSDIPNILRGIRRKRPTKKRRRTKK